MTIEQAFGHAIRRLRKERGISQDTLAATSNLDRTFISLIECGKKNPTLITIFQLARGLNVSTERILSEVEAVMSINGSPPSSSADAANLNVKLGDYDTEVLSGIVSDKPRKKRKGAILLVDDEEVTRSYIDALLSLLGYQVLAASNGHQAVEMYDSSKDEIRLIIMDVVMPHCNGIDAFSRIRTSQPNAKIIYMSGYDAECLQLPQGDQVFLKKPFNPMEFVAIVQQCLES